MSSKSAATGENRGINYLDLLSVKLRIVNSCNMYKFPSSNFQRSNIFHLLYSILFGKKHSGKPINSITSLTVIIFGHTIALHITFVQSGARTVGGGTSNKNLSVIEMQHFLALAQC